MLGCKPTYEGLKPDWIEKLAGIRPRCKPTYEGLKPPEGAGRNSHLSRCKPTYEGLKPRSPPERGLKAGVLQAYL